MLVHLVFFYRYTFAVHFYKGNNICLRSCKYCVNINKKLKKIMFQLFEIFCSVDTMKSLYMRPVKIYAHFSRNIIFFFVHCMCFVLLKRVWKEKNHVTSPFTPFSPLQTECIHFLRPIFPSDQNHASNLLLV